ncbi:MAG TPA: capsule assembly Wzi family protein [Steroidobacteraceae bacterium]
MTAAWRRRARVLALVPLALLAARAQADAGWFESGDTLLRNDLQLLNDAEVIRYPLNQWPIPRAGIRHALDNAKPHYATNANVQAALARVRARLDEAAPGSQKWTGSLTAGEPGLLRDFDAAGREQGELAAAFSHEGERFAVGLSITGAVDPADDQQVRADGSHASLLLGNWLLSANTLDRWWGPAHESSLILSNNARPMPTVMVERAEARPFESRWLQWLGPWRFSFGISQMESEREDIDRPLFMAWRVVVMPFKDIELGFSRTAQFCGEQLVCDLNSFGNMLAGNDNVGIDATPENEPGNQMAGFDIRWNSPIGNLPYAIYSQMIGEDESSYLPVKYLNQFGFETWKPLRAGLVQVFAEYSATTCSATSSRGPYYNCAYNQGRFGIEGYRYRGRVIGHTADNDAEVISLGGSLTRDDGSLWTATLRSARLNFDGVDARNTVSPGPADYAAAEFGWQGRLFGESVKIELGVESNEPEGGDRNVDPFGFLSWRHEFR